MTPHQEDLLVALGVGALVVLAVWAAVWLTLNVLTGR